LRDQHAAIGVDERAGSDKGKFDAHSLNPDEIQCQQTQFNAVEMGFAAIRITMTVTP
jgi:hypothetical protein